MNTRISKQQWQEEEALRRFQLISPLLQADLDDAIWGCFGNVADDFNKIEKIHLSQYYYI